MIGTMKLSPTVIWSLRQDPESSIKSCAVLALSVIKPCGNLQQPGRVLHKPCASTTGLSFSNLAHHSHPKLPTPLSKEDTLSYRKKPYMI